MKSIKMYFLSALLTVFIGCASMYSIDEAIEVTAWETVDMLSENESRILAVYYFTLSDEKHHISEYMIDRLTTEIANVINYEELDMKIVSRQALDHILEELSFQMFDLVDKTTQVSVGKQLGADIILSGTITPIEDYYKLNVQLIEVQSGVVLGGALLEFWMDEEEVVE
jgi:TolB-like protein